MACQDVLVSSKTLLALDPFLYCFVLSVHELRKGDVWTKPLSRVSLKFDDAADTVSDIYRKATYIMPHSRDGPTLLA